MKRATSSLIVLVGLFVGLVGLNMVFLVEERDARENEENAKRSSYRTTKFGTHAYYTLLLESGLPVTRFEKPYTDLKSHPEIGTLVVIAPPLAGNPTREEFESVSQWVEEGGLLIIIDRDIVGSFGSVSAMTGPAGRSLQVSTLQPTALTRGVTKVGLSDLATQVHLKGESVTYHVGAAVPTMGDLESGVLAEARSGEGRILFLTDPYVVANNGLLEDDNVILALNLVSERPDGRIAFDEYHHGYGGGVGGSGGLMSYFSGTPVPWILGQAALVGILLVYTRGRRFARPVPLRRERRTTNLEFVSSMANITRLARATELAMQNIYPEFRRKLCRYSGLPANTDIKTIARKVGARSNFKERELWQLLSQCESAVGGQTINDSELLKLVARIREIESDLKL